MKQYNLKLTPEISYIVGTLLGDGNNEKTWGKLRFGVKDYNFIIKIKNNLEKQFQKQLKIRKRKNNDSYLYHIEICSKFISNNIDDKIKEIKKSNNKKVLCYFLEGCFDSEGSTDKKRLRIRFVNMNKEYIKIITLSLTKLKIKYFLKKDKNNLFWIRIYEKECIKFHKIIHFSIKYKEENLKINIQNFKNKIEYNKKKRKETLFLKEKEWCKKYKLTRNQYYRYKRLFYNSNK
jgi:hypothetical protein